MAFAVPERHTLLPGLVLEMIHFQSFRIVEISYQVDDGEFGVISTLHFDGFKKLEDADNSAFKESDLEAYMKVFLL